MTDNIVTFKGKRQAVDPTNVPQWLMAYATTIVERKEEERPRNVIVLELFDVDGGDNAHDVWVAGPKMKGLELIGLLEMVKSHIAFEQCVENSE